MSYYFDMGPPEANTTGQVINGKKPNKRRPHPCHRAFPFLLSQVRPGPSRPLRLQADPCKRHQGQLPR